MDLDALNRLIKAVAEYEDAMRDAGSNILKHQQLIELGKRLMEEGQVQLELVATAWTSIERQVQAASLALEEIKQAVRAGEIVQIRRLESFVPLLIAHTDSQNPSSSELPSEIAPALQIVPAEPANPENGLPLDDAQVIAARQSLLEVLSNQPSVPVLIPKNEMVVDISVRQLSLSRTHQDMDRLKKGETPESLVQSIVPTWRRGRIRVRAPKSTENRPEQEKQEVVPPDIAAPPTLPPTVTEVNHDRPQTSSKLIKPKTKQVSPPDSRQHSKDPGPSPVTETLWMAIEQGDLATAFWLSYGSSPKTIPPWILRACFFASQTRSNHDEPSRQISGIIEDHPQLLDELSTSASNLTTLEHILLGALATVRPALLAPDLGICSWFEEIAECTSEVTPLFSIIQPLVRQGLALDSRSIHQAEEVRRIQQLAAQQAVAAKDWVAKQKSSGFGHDAARGALHRLATDATEIGKAMLVTAGNRVDRAATVRTVLQQHMATSRQLVDEVNPQVNLVSVAPVKLPHTLVESLVHRLDEARTVMKGWLEAVEHLDGSNPDWRQDQVNQFWAGVNEAIEQVSTGLADASVRSAGIRILANTLCTTTLKLVNELRGDAIEGHAKDSDGTWEDRLLRPLLFLSSIALSEGDSLPLELDTNAALELADYFKVPPQPEHVVERHIAARNYAMARLTANLVVSATEKSGFIAKIEDAHAEEAAAFQRRIEQLRSQLETAVIDHVLLESERAQIEGEIAALEGREATSIRNFGPLHAHADSVMTRLRDLRAQRLESLRNLLKDLKNRLDQDRDSVGLEIINRTEEALLAEELALADELVAQFEEYLENGLTPALNPEPSTSTELEGFRETLPGLIQTLETDERRGGRELLALLLQERRIGELRRLPEYTAEQMTELQRAIDAFKTFQRRPDSRTESTLHPVRLQNLLRFLGWQSPEATLVKVDKFWWHFAVQMSDGGASPLPQFGSERKRQYDVMLVWDQVPSERLEQYLLAAGVSDNCPLVVFLGRMSARQRDEWGSRCFRNNLTALILDEPLLWYLATVPEKRLQSLMACSMPWGYANPYTPFAAMDVPPEMFKGRTAIIQDLESLLGPSIIYGGRQLGKSAILRMIERRFHNPGKNQYVFLKDIHSVGDPVGDHPTSEVWRHIRDWAARLRLLDQKVLDRAPNVTHELIRALDRVPDLRILILLDEADHFLEADAHKNFEEVQNLKQLMIQSKRQFKVVFSGLHSVGRFCGISNHPFAHLGSPINIRPLDPREAQALIRHPMEVLGYRFESDDVIHRILAYTNYHPALIQHFCSELIRTRRGIAPPYSITLRGVEEVYRRREVRTVMRERFEWTVGLDARYELLVYSMILDQLHAHDGYRRVYSVSDALRAVENWHRDKAAHMTVEDAQTLMEELVGLGVLVKRDDGRYRLRNANVVRALGSDSEIMDQLDKAIRKPLKAEFDMRKLRANLEQTNAWSPLTLEQEGAILRRDLGVHLLFGSPALGLDHLPAALARIARGTDESSEPNGVLFCPEECSSVAAFHSFLDRQLSERESGTHLLVLPGSALLKFPEGVSKAISDIASVLGRRRSRRRSLHCVIVFSIPETVEWSKLPATERQLSEGRASSVAVCGLWGPEMVERYLNRHEMLTTRDTVEAVMKSTGGWPWLVDQMHQVLATAYPQSLAHRDPREAAEHIGRAIRTSSALSEGFVQAAGHPLRTVSAVVRVATTFEGLVSRSDLTSELLEVELSPEDIESELLTMERLGLLRIHESTVTVDPIVQRAIQR